MKLSDIAGRTFSRTEQERSFITAVKSPLYFLSFLRRQRMSPATRLSLLTTSQSFLRYFRPHRNDN